MSSAATAVPRLSRFAVFAIVFLGWLAGSFLSAQIILDSEDAQLLGTKLSSPPSGISGRSHIAGFKNKEAVVRWQFMATNGLFYLNIHFRSPHGPKDFTATLNGFVIFGTFPQTNDFGTYSAGLVQLTNGVNILQIGGGWNYYEIERADLIPAAVPAPPLPVPAAPANPHATLATRQLMARMVADYGKVTWAGQDGAFDATNVFKLSARWPVIVAGDFMDYSPSRVRYGGHPKNLSKKMIALANSGFVLSMQWHWNAPTNLLNTSDEPWWRSFYTEATTFDVAAAMANTNSAEHTLLLRDMDVIAAQLNIFSSNNIPVLWRPLHESEGGWFWWGAQGPEAFKQLWRLLYNRLTQYHGLNNLIWVLSSEDPAWYPGDDVVDIIGVDAYPTDRSDPLSARWEALKTRFNGKKLIALTEFGGAPDIPKMQQFGVWFSYFAPWSGRSGPTSMPTDTVVRIYQSTNVLTLKDRR